MLINHVLNRIIARFTKYVFIEILKTHDEMGDTGRKILVVAVGEILLSCITTVFPTQPSIRLESELWDGRDQPNRFSSTIATRRE